VADRPNDQVVTAADPGHTAPQIAGELRLRREQPNQRRRSRVIFSRRAKDPSEQAAASIAVLRQQQQENNVRRVGLMNMPKHKRAKDDLTCLGSDAVPALLAVLATPRKPASEAPDDYIENDVANDIAEVLGAIGDARAVEPLMACFRQYIVTAPRALAQFPAGVDALLGALDDPDDFMRSTSLDGLAFSPDGRAADAVAGALRDPAPWVRRSAAHATLIRGTASQAVVAEIGRMAREDPDPKVRKMAENAFLKLSGG
jgi:HEAT repeat protein